MGTPPAHPPDLAQIRLLLLDVDGVLTDGRVYYADDGTETKAFHTQDGLGIRLLQKAGIRLGFITGRISKAVRRRARELDIEILYEGVRDKAGLVAEIADGTGIPSAHMAFVGDDLVDLPVMARVGASFAVANAVKEVRHAAAYVTSAPGGQGAVREVAEAILKAQNRWEELLRTFQ